MQQLAFQRLGLLLLVLALGSVVRGAPSPLLPTLTIDAGAHPLPLAALTQLASADGLKQWDKQSLDASRCDGGPPIRYHEPRPCPVLAAQFVACLKVV